MEPIVNKVAQSDIEVFDLGRFAPERDPVEIDIADWLEGGFVLREKPFREAVAAVDWTAYAGRMVAVTCSADAIVPVWAYMLVASRLEGIADAVVMGTAKDALRDHFARALAAFDWSQYEDRIVVVKGCGTVRVPESAYVAATTALQTVARKLMYGEPCSAVPLWRRKKS